MVDGGKILICVTGGLAVGISVVCYPFVAPALRRVCLPYVPATPRQVENVLGALESVGAGGRLLDIGSGDGRIVVAAAERGFDAAGVELNPWLVHYSRWSALRKGVSSKTAFHRRDLWTHDMSPYRSLVVFGVEEMMPRLEEKIRAEAPKGSAVVACRFPFKTIEPLATVGEGVDTVWCYRLD